MIKWLLIASVAFAQDVPFFQRSVDKDQDIGGLEKNFRSLSDKGKDSVGNNSDIGTTCTDDPTFCVETTSHEVIMANRMRIPIVTTTTLVTTFVNKGDFFAVMNHDGAIFSTCIATATCTGTQASSCVALTTDTLKRCR